MVEAYESAKEDEMAMNMNRYGTRERPIMVGSEEFERE